MNRWMAGGAGSVVSAGLLVALAVPGLAQEDPTYEEFQREAFMEPLEPRPGQQVTVGDDTCHEGTTDLWWALRPQGQDQLVDADRVQLAPDGGWQVTLTAPEEPGDYLFFALCLPPGVEVPSDDTIDLVRDEGVPVELLEGWGVDSLTYYAMLVPVVDDTPAPPGPNPDRPDQPDHPDHPDQPDHPDHPDGPGRPTGHPRATAPTPIPADPDFAG